jgi:hypothetical protein
MKRCSATRCCAHVAKGQLFCGAHWALVPERTRRAIHGAWRARDMQAYAEAFDAARNAIDLADGTFEDVMAPPPVRWVVPQHLGAAR